MKALQKTLPSILAALLFAAGAQAATITFSEVSLDTTNPTIGGITFTAGTDDLNNSVYNSAITYDPTFDPNDPNSVADQALARLLNGYADGTNGTPSGDDAYIGISGMKFGSAYFDFDAINLLPNNLFSIKAYLDGNEVGSISTDASGNYGFTIAGGFNELRLMDGPGGAFAIDNFSYERWTAPPDPNPMPEPSVIGLLGLGLLGLAYARRKQVA